MKYYAILAFLLFTAIGLPETLAMCTVNEDWPDAPCMDMIVNGHYPQEQVDRWAGYYDYKGAEFIKEKKQEKIIRKLEAKQAKKRKRAS